MPVLPKNVGQFGKGSGGCASMDCGAAATATGINGANGTAFGAAYIRKLSGAPCTDLPPGVSGGLATADIERAARKKGVTVDFGRTAQGLLGPPRDMAELKDRTKDSVEYAVLLGDYEGIPSNLRESRTFQGDHWAGVTDFRESDNTFAFYDPLADEPTPKRMKAGAVKDYWLDVRKNSQARRGHAGFFRWEPKEPEVEPVVIIQSKDLPGARCSAPAGSELLVIEYDPATDKETSRDTPTLLVALEAPIDREIFVSRNTNARPNGTFVHVTDGQFKDHWIDKDDVTVTGGAAGAGPGMGVEATSLAAAVAAGFNEGVDVAQAAVLQIERRDVPV